MTDERKIINFLLFIWPLMFSILLLFFSDHLVFGHEVLFLITLQLLFFSDHLVFGHEVLFLITLQNNVKA
jgi:hypothetical protein